ncbi:ABC transporter ATP-binding protein [Actinomadura sp. NEAU-AAG7]|uniref:ABC transporter ATP-binding protein n=1 Tax=Actinomadura sp. NEAU-AAG7 TaxID=2839640 RepID=UPI001BE3E534|nr:ABC transporter ATP-binding protein [Actinomadura sp. NEAU-AAG7]MBT2209896.1 ABC transporter ATP-binding protein/permease [Actinomadura sp. NEAU-AAG7]
MDADVPGTPRSSAIACLTEAVRLAVRASGGELLLYVPITLFAGVCPVAIAWLTKLLLDGLVRPRPHVPGWLPVGLTALGAVYALSPQVVVYLRAEMDRKISLFAQDELFGAVNAWKGLARFEDPRSLDGLRMAQQAASAAPGSVLEGVLASARGAITVTGFLGALFTLSPVLTLLVVAAGVPVLVAETALAKARVRMLWRVGPVERREIAYGQLLTSVEAAKEVRLFGIGAFLRRRMSEERRKANRARRRVDGRELLMQVGLGAVAALVSGYGLVWSVSAALDGRLSAGDVTVVVASITGLQGAFAVLSNEIARARQATLMLAGYVDLVRAAPDLAVARPRAAPAPPPVPWPPAPRIEFRDVWFRYSDEHPWVLRGLNLEIPPGEATAIVGANGAGKSTLVKLLCRFYDPTRGTILWDGVELARLDVDELRARISAVFQDYMRYDISALENIAVGDLSRMRDERHVVEAASRARIHERLLSLPGGYGTPLTRMFPAEDGEGEGVVLSGGEWQRIALARAFLRADRDLMILDEPSSGLDAESEHEIHTTLLDLRRRSTSVLVSHRLNAVRDADRIAVIKDGAVAELGDHETLMRKKGEYFRMFDLQSKGYT